MADECKKIEERKKGEYLKNMEEKIAWSTYSERLSFSFFL